MGPHVSRERERKSARFFEVCSPKFFERKISQRYVIFPRETLPPGYFLAIESLTLPEEINGT